MTYQFPARLASLRAWLAARHVDVTALKSERQTAFFAQQLAGTRFKFPAKGRSCAAVLDGIQAHILTVNVDSERARLTENIISDGARSLRTKRSDLSGEIPSDDRPEMSNALDKRVRSGSGRNRPSSSRKPLPNTALTHDPEIGLVIFCDGACEPNPGAGGWAFVIYRDGVEIHSECGGDPVSTNNIMEMTGALMALRWIASCDRSQDSPRLLCDSQYVVRGCNEWRHGWKAKGWKRGGPKAKEKNSAIANLDLWKELDAALTVTPITLEWVKGHAGTKGNERADELADMGRLDALSPIGDKSPPDDMRAAIEQQLAVPA